MTSALKAIDGSADLPALMTELAKGARAAARVLALAPTEQKNRALEAIERAIRSHSEKILAANAEDVAEVKAGGATSASPRRSARNLQLRATRLRQNS